MLLGIGRFQLRYRPTVDNHWSSHKLCVQRNVQIGNEPYIKKVTA